MVLGKETITFSEFVNACKVTVPTFKPLSKIVFPFAKETFSLDVQELEELTQLKVLFVEPFNVIPPPSAVASVGEAVFPKVILISLTSTVVALILVVLPLTYKLPETVRF